jgi:RHS repeat-associated protein
LLSQKSLNRFIFIFSFFITAFFAKAMALTFPAPGPIPTPLAPSYINAPANSTGNFTISWGMPTDDNNSFLKFSTASSNTSFADAFALKEQDACQGSCSTQYTYEYLLEQSKNNGSYVQVFSGNTYQFSAVNYAVGNYRYRVKVRNSNGFIVGAYSPYTYSGTVNVALSTIPEHVTEVDDAPIQSLSNELPVNEYNNVQLKGTSTVDGGAFSYQLPIAVPPGRNNLAPNVALSYSSQSGVGVAGYGWSLSATGSVARCASNFSIDGYASNVVFSAADKLCLNGSRLINVAGSYGYSGTRYKTEVDSGVIVEQLGGSSTSSYAYFRVTHKNGRISYYGDDSDSRFKPAGAAAVLRWYQRKDVDQFDNNILYSYQRNDGNMLLKTIHYTGTGNSQGNRSITFDYTQLTAPTHGYIWGGKVTRTHQLSGISIVVPYNNGADTRRYYDLNYQGQQLSSVRLCETRYCSPVLAQTSFSWFPTKLSYSEQNSHPLASVSASDDERLATAPYKKSADYDGDGISDIETTDDEIFLSSSTSYSQKLDLNDLPDFSRVLAQNNESYLNTVEGDIDYDGDGRADFIYTDSNHRLKIAKWDSDNNTFSTLLNTGINAKCAMLPSESIIGMNPCRSFVFDVNGDGYEDIISSTRTNQNSPYLFSVYTRNRNSADIATSGFSYAGQFNWFDIRFSMSMADIDGDGQIDLYSTRQAKWLKFSFTNNQLSLVRKDLNIDGSLGGSLRQKTTIWLDSNGDGLLDAMVLREVNGPSGTKQLNWHIAINKGKGLFNTPINTGLKEFLAPGASTRNGMPPNENATLANFTHSFDYNGDGRADMLVPSTVRYKYDCWDLRYNTDCMSRDEDTGADRTPYYAYDVWKWKVLQSNADGVSFSEVILDSNIVGSLATTGLVDVNGDGSLDIISSLGWEEYQGNLFNCGPGNASASGRIHCYSSSAPATGVYVYQHAINNNNLIESVDDGFDTAFTLSYQALSYKFKQSDALYLTDNAPNADRRYTRIGSGMKVVQNIKTRNGVGGFNQTDYFYENGLFHIQGRGFQGFEAIIAKNKENGLTTRTEYEQIFPRSGMVNRKKTYKESGGRLISLYQANSFADVWCSTLEQGIYGPHARTTQNTQYELTTGAQVSNTTSESYYSCRGTPRQVRTIHSDAIQQQQSLTVNTLVNGTNSFVERLTNTTASQSTKYLGWSGWAPGNSTVTTQKRYSDFSNERARKTEQCGAISSSASTTIAPLNCSFGSDLTRVQQVVLDGYGNATRLTSSSTGSGGSYTDIQGSRWLQTQYESQGYFPTKTFNSQWGTTITASETTIDKLLGQATSIKDVSGVEQRLGLDKLGRVITTAVKKGSNNIAPTRYTAYRACDNYEGCPSLANYSVTQVQDGTPTSVSYFDANNRAIQTKTRSFTGSWVYTSKTFGARGQVFNETQPNDGYVGATTTTYSQHDALGRVGTKSVDNYPMEYTTRYAYNGLTTNISVTPDRNTTGGVTAFNVSRTYNSLKQLIRTTDANSKKSYFAYKANGSPSVIKDANGNLIKAHYNGLGHKTSLDDPNMGHWEYRYNALGELRYQKDATNITSVFNYDKIGRKTSQVAGGETQRWYYDSAVGYGKLRYDTRNGNNSYSRYYGYDSLGRANKETLNANGQSIVNETAFDSHYGRVKAQGYGGKFAIIEHQYNEYGYPTVDIDTKTGKKLISRNRYNAMGNVTEQQFSNQLIQTFNYENNLTQVNAVCTNTSTSCSSGSQTQSQLYDYDAFGNVTRRNDTAGGRNESYRYDLLQRVIKATVSVGGLTVPMDYNYDSVGNLTKKGDYASLYRYGNTNRNAGGNAGPNAVRELTLLSGGKANLSYDNNGNLKTSTHGNLAINYNAAMKPRTISRNGQSISFKYDANEQRFLQVKGSGTSQVTKYYAGNYELEIKANGTRVQKAYIGQHSIISDEQYKPRVVHSSVDRLGSVTSLTDGDKSLNNSSQTGLLIQRRGYDVFGRAFNAYNNNTLSAFSTTPKGFTGHEHLPEVGLIHMNGRGFDPLLGRFLSVDPFIQSPTNTQSINPYSYIFNNPLSGTDPTGYVSEEIAEINGGTVTESQNEDEVAVESGQQNDKAKTSVSDGRSINKVSAISGSSSGVTDINDSTNQSGTPLGDNQENDTPIIHMVTGDNSPDYYTDDGIPAWVTTAPRASSNKEGIRNPSQPKPRARSGSGFWREIGRVYGKGSSGTFVGSRKVKLNFFDEQGLAIANGMHFSINYQQLGKDGKPIPTYSSEAHGQLMKALPMGLTYELYGGNVDRFSWHVKSKNTQASCDTCGAGGIKVSEFVYE